MSKTQFEISIDHAMMAGAKQAFDKCLQMAVARAIGTGSDEGSAALKISFSIVTTVDEDTGELRRMPIWKYKAGFNVPMKESMDATIPETGNLIEQAGGWKLVNGQISMEELLAEDEDK